MNYWDCVDNHNISRQRPKFWASCPLRSKWNRSSAIPKAKLRWWVCCVCGHILVIATPVLKPQPSRSGRSSTNCKCKKTLTWLLIFIKKVSLVFDWYPNVNYRVFLSKLFRTCERCNIYYLRFWCEYLFNKKVLLRERNRHTARRVASPGGGGGGGGGFIPWLGGGGTYLGWGRGYLPWPGGGGTYLSQGGEGYSPWPEEGGGVTTLAGMGYPSPPVNLQSETITFSSFGCGR